MGDITRLLSRWADGDAEAFKALMPVVYELGGSSRDPRAELTQCQVTDDLYSPPSFLP